MHAFEWDMTLLPKSKTKYTDEEGPATGVGEDGKRFIQAIEPRHAESMVRCPAARMLTLKRKGTAARGGRTFEMIQAI